MSEKPICVILCAGKGSRMNSSKTHKVCFHIAGVPAIHRLMGNLQEAGIDRFAVVVGTMADKVIECVSERFDDVLFVAQKAPMGTGHAALTALKAIRKAGIAGPVLVVMGDKIIEPGIIKELLQTYRESGAKAVVTVQPKALNRSGGRVILDVTRSVRGIVESLDIQKAMVCRQALGLVTGEMDAAQIWQELESASREIVPGEKNRNKILAGIRAEAGGQVQALLSVLAEHGTIRIGQEAYEPADVEGTDWVNGAAYLFGQDALAMALDRISSRNAQNEIYLTDAVNLLAHEALDGLETPNVREVRAPGEHQVMAFNTVEELLGIEQYFNSLAGGPAVHLPPETLKPVGEWIRLLEEMPAPVQAAFAEVYGEDDGIIRERERFYRCALNCARERFGEDRRVIISRAPGRVNLMGRHVEHRGGFVNVISINKELLVVASPREDDRITITNVNPDFQDRSFRISDYLTDLNWNDWVSFIESDAIRTLVQQTKGDWSNYVKAAVLKLQYTYQDVKLRGMDMVFCGDIPMAAGLSSSSAIIVATAEAAVAINNLDVTVQRFVDLCGEGEWFVGSRGGSGDHAAMKFGSRGTVAHLGFFPFGFHRAIRFPAGYQLLIANSHIKAQKSSGAKDLFNQRVASYEFGLMLLKQRYPQYADRMERLRDVTPQHLGVLPSRIYEMLLQLPETIRPECLFEELPEALHGRVRQIMGTHQAPEVYHIRSVILYGIAECLRSRNCADLLESGDYRAFGQMMGISHDGDRVAAFAGGEQQAYDWRVPESHILDLIDDLKSEDPARVRRAQLEMQPGGYACSTPEIDFIVDLAKSVPGVIGAQLSGAGLGGCVMVLVESAATPALIQTLNEQYYQPRGLESGILVAVPVQGSMVWSLSSGQEG